MFREFFRHPDYRLSQKKKKKKKRWILSNKDTDFCFHIADAISGVNDWLKWCCYVEVEDVLENMGGAP